MKFKIENTWNLFDPDGLPYRRFKIRNGFNLFYLNEINFKDHLELLKVEKDHLFLIDLDKNVYKRNEITVKDKTITILYPVQSTEKFDNSLPDLNNIPLLNLKNGNYKATIKYMRGSEIIVAFNKKGETLRFIKNLSNDQSESAIDRAKNAVELFQESFTFGVKQKITLNLLKKISTNIVFVELIPYDETLLDFLPETGDSIRSEEHAATKISAKTKITASNTSTSEIIDEETILSELPDGKYPIQLTEDGKTISGFLVRTGGNTHVEGLPVKTIETINALVVPYNEEAALKLSDLQEFGINIKFLAVKNIKSINNLLDIPFKDLKHGKYNIVYELESGNTYDFVITVNESGISLNEDLIRKGDKEKTKILFERAILDTYHENPTFGELKAASKQVKNIKISEYKEGIKDFPRDTGGSIGLDEEANNKLAENKGLSKRPKLNLSKLKGLKLRPLTLHSLDDFVNRTYELRLKFSDNSEESVLFTVLDDEIIFPDDLSERQNKAIEKIFGTVYTEQGKPVLLISKLNAKMQGFSFSVHTAKSKSTEPQNDFQSEFSGKTGGSFSIDENEPDQKSSKNNGKFNSTENINLGERPIGGQTKKQANMNTTASFKDQLDEKNDSRNITFIQSMLKLAVKEKVDNRTKDKLLQLINEQIQSTNSKELDLLKEIRDDLSRLLKPEDSGNASNNDETNSELPKYLNPVNLSRFLVAFNQDPILKYTCHEIDSEDIINAINDSCGIQSYDIIFHQQLIEKRCRIILNKHYVNHRIKNLILAYLTGSTHSGGNRGWSSENININWKSPELKKWGEQNPGFVPNPGTNLINKTKNRGYKFPQSIKSNLTNERINSFSK
ncbi:MAG: hypothetical protein RBR74_13820, partial [Ignavibacteriaceae bacterium]|nr:hypothetical protein [Ignavibacteriaceae bacterium]